MADVKKVKAVITAGKFRDAEGKPHLPGATVEVTETQLQTFKDCMKPYVAEEAKKAPAVTEANTAPKGDANPAGDVDLSKVDESGKQGAGDNEEASKNANASESQSNPPAPPLDTNKGGILGTGIGAKK